MAQLNFNAATVEPNAAFDPIPAGWYTAQVVESEIKPTNAGDGSYLSITLQVLGGAFNNRKVFDRFNINNKNPVAVDIAYKQLSALCHAAGVMQVQDSQQLHGRPVQIKVALRPASVDAATGKSYDANNEVKGYKAIEAGGGQQMGQPQGGAPAWAATGQPAPQQPQAQAPAWQQQAPVQQAQPPQPQQQPQWQQAQPPAAVQQPPQQQWAPPVQQQQPVQQPQQQQQAPVQQAQMPQQAQPQAQAPWAGGAPANIASQPVAEPPQAQAAAADNTPPWAR